MKTKNVRILVRGVNAQIPDDRLAFVVLPVLKRFSRDVTVEEVSDVQRVLSSREAEPEAVEPEAGNASDGDADANGELAGDSGEAATS